MTGQVRKPKSIVLSKLVVPVPPGSLPVASVMSGLVDAEPAPPLWIPIFSLSTPLSVPIAIVAEVKDVGGVGTER